MTNIKIAAPKRGTITSMPEVDMMLNLHKVGKTQKEVKETVDSFRRASGTFTGKGISTNTISRLLSPKTQKAFIKKAEHAEARFAGRKRQKNVWAMMREGIKDPKERHKFDKGMKRIIEQSKGNQYVLDIRKGNKDGKNFGVEDDGFHLAETDEWYPDSP